MRIWFDLQTCSYTDQKPETHELQITSFSEFNLPNAPSRPRPHHGRRIRNRHRHLQLRRHQSLNCQVLHSRILFSVNMSIPTKEVKIEGTPKIFEDKDSKSGNTVNRNFGGGGDVCLFCSFFLYALPNPKWVGLEHVYPSLEDMGRAFIRYPQTSGFVSLPLIFSCGFYVASPNRVNFPRRCSLASTRRPTS